MRTDLSEDLVPEGSLPSTVDEYAARRFVTLANRSSRRSFLALVGRASLALMGGTFLGIWRAESAWAQCGGREDETGRVTCLCLNLIGSNQCPQCCGSFWRSCATVPRVSLPKSQSQEIPLRPALRLLQQLLGYRLSPRHRLRRWRDRGHLLRGRILHRGWLSP